MSIQKKYDYLIVGAGLYGATFARLATDAGKTCLVIEKRTNVGGNCEDYLDDGIMVHKHGAHIFHTSSDRVWSFVNKFGEFVQFQNNVKAWSHAKMYSLPFNMNTFNQIWSCTTPDEAKRLIQQEIDTEYIDTPQNLEEQALKLVGRSIYQLLIKDYTEKQWGRPCKELSADIIKRLPLRFTYDNNYFNDKYQAIPRLGYSQLVANMLSDIDVRVCTDFFAISDWRLIANKLVYTGQIDKFFNYEFGKLDWRTLLFQTEKLDVDNYQGCPVMNFCDSSVDYTRIIEHKHFLKTQSANTIITIEYPKKFVDGDEPYYPIKDKKNAELLQKYLDKAKSCQNVILGGRLGTYQYLDMDKVIEQAMSDFARDTNAK